MSIAVVIALHNGAAWIGETLASVASQELAPVEVVVVDDASTDDGPSIVRSFAGVRLLAAPDVPARGSLPARNLGFAKTHAPFVAFLDHDDVWHPAHLKSLRNALQVHADAPLAFTRASSFGPGEAPSFSAGPLRTGLHDPYVAYPWGTGIPTPSAMLLRRDRLESIGGWDEAVGSMGDVDVVWRLAADRPCVVCEARTVGKREHPGSQSASLRAELDHLGYLREIARRAQGLRARCLTDEAERAQLERRWKVFDPLSELARSVAERSCADLSERALALEAALLEEPEPYLDRVIHFLLYSVCRESTVGRLRAAESALLQRLLARWPAGAPRVRAALVRRPWPLGMYVRSLVPGRGLRWRDAVYATVERARRRRERRRQGRAG